MTPEEFWSILHAMPEPQPVSYLLYHDDQGHPLFYSMEAVPGTYIEIDQVTFARGAMNVRVREGRLIEVTWATTTKLVPGHSGTPCHPDNVAVVVDEGQPHTRWSKRTVESDSK
jgi:hypothetical protein